MKTKLVIFGITGDLASRKLLPALKHIFNANKIADLEIIGVSRRSVDLQALLENSIGKTNFADKFSMHKMDMLSAADYDELKRKINLQTNEQLLVYLSVPPTAVLNIVEHLGNAGINSENVKLMFEKPFGVDYRSALEMVEHVNKFFTEQQQYRIDHYLAKEMAQNIVIMRGANALFRHIWNKNFISSVEVTAAESIDIEGRANFYEQTGALRDVLQGHVLQVLALILSDIPAGFEWNDLVRVRQKTFEKLQPANPQKSIRAQYEGYKNEVKNLNSMVETFVSLELESNDEDWVGVPLRITTGKALDKKYTEAVVRLKPIGEAYDNKIIFRIQPNEGIEIDFYVKTPGYERAIGKQKMSFNFLTNVDRMPDAYEQVFIDAAEGQKSLFASSNEVLKAWEIVAPVQDAWNINQTELVVYPKGSSVKEIIGH